MNLPSISILLTVGLVAGIASGLFGIGGGVLIVPGLVFLLGFSQHMATGTSLAILLPPVGIAAVLEYYHHGNVDLKAAFIVAASLLAGAWVGALLANHLKDEYLRLAFGVFVVGIGVYVIVVALKRLSWI
jgi:uncharacterized membrane protein YfcA